MNTLVAKLALDWLRAEHAAPAEDLEQEAGGYPSDTQKLIITAIRADAAEQVWSNESVAKASSRVYDVLRGEVRWSETTPGDRAIWKGRLRDIGRFESWWRTGKGEAPNENSDLPDGDGMAPVPVEGIRASSRGPRLHGYRERLWWNYYDTHSVTRDSHSTQWPRLFGNKNVGNSFLSNLQMAGQLGYGDASFVILGIYVTVSHLDALRYIADQMHGQLVIGNKPMTPRVFGRDLFLGINLQAPGARPIIVPTRQNVTFELNFKSELPDDMDPFDVVVHLDGLETRSIQ